MHNETNKQTQTHRASRQTDRQTDRQMHIKLFFFTHAQGTLTIESMEAVQSRALNRTATLDHLINFLSRFFQTVQETCGSALANPVLRVTCVQKYHTDTSASIKTKPLVKIRLALKV